ncbi:MAG: UvrD-helicase domain-containing protein [Myxococcales bacterium]
MTLGDAKARDLIQTNFDKTLVVEAAAGTGKTTELVGRIVALLRSGRTTLDRILAVTFTDKAAGEMKLRLRTSLEAAREKATGAEQDRLTDALRLLEVAQISTIHSFCADLLREWPVEARIDPLFELAAGETADRLFAQAFDSWFQRELEAPGEGFRRALRRRQRGWNPQSPRQALLDAAWTLSEQRDFDAAWRRAPFDRSAELSQVVDRLADVAAFAPRASDREGWLAKSLADIARFVDELRRREEIRGRDEDGLEAQLCELSRLKSWNWKGSGKWFAEGIERSAVLARRDEAKDLLDSFVERAGADLAARLREELRAPLTEYEELKRRSGKLDFLDLLLRARDLVRDAPQVREGLQRRFTHLLVDEFQDTDPLQAELLLLLSAEDPEGRDWTKVKPVPGKLFLVGDPKQSVYRFRRADIALYQRVKDLLVSRGAEVVHLTTSFRAVPSLQEAVNAAFSARMVRTPESCQAEYVPLDRYRPEPEGRPTVIALPAPHIYGDNGKVAYWKIQKSYPIAVGAFVDWLLHKSGWTVTERDKAPPVPVQARHVCVLFKRMYSFGEDLVRDYVRALEARGIPHVLVGGGSYHEREETLALRNSVSAIEWPSDELSVFATLRGPFFALGDDALLAFRKTHGRLHPLRRFESAPLDDETRAVAESLAVLGELHRFRNRRPIADTVGRLLDATRAHAGLAMAHAGEQALANALRVLDLARRFESASATSFRSFVDWLYLCAERGDTGEAPVVEEGTEGVRMMTVHGAKGLEFPVVILADPSAPSAPKNPSRFVDPERRLCAMPLIGCVPSELQEERETLVERDREETVRTAYVAATRARDLLVVPVNGDEERESWLDALNPAVYPEAAERRDPRPAPGCPAFSGRDTVLDRPENAAFSAARIRPGLHRPRAGKHLEVVWWDPKALDLERDAERGLRRESLLVEAEGAAKEVDAGVAKAHEAWRDRRAATLAAGSAPTLRLIAPTALTAAEKASSSFDAVADRDPRRPRGKRFGILLHATLADVDLHADSSAIALLAANLGRTLGATDEEVAAAGAATAAALRHPLVRRAAASPDCRREVPVSHVLGDGTLVEGTVDLAFREKTGWTVVDFKSDARPEDEPRYRSQIAAYVEAIRAATGEPGSGVILAV